MNCLDFRRACLVDPEPHDPEFRAHAEHCPACSEFLRGQRRVEEHLRQALAVAPPESLAARILLRRSFSQRLRRPLAIAATVIVSLTGGMLAFHYARPPALETAVLAHILAEPEHLLAPQAAAPDKLTSVLHALGVDVDTAGSQVRYAGICDIRNRPGAHLVLTGRRGPVTVLILPGETVTGRRPIRGHGLEGALLPAGPGSVAIVGQPGEALETLERQLRVRFHG
jgi:hypothetical protein